MTQERFQEDLAMAAEMFRHKHLWEELRTLMWDYQHSPDYKRYERIYTAEFLQGFDTAFDWVLDTMKELEEK